MDSQLQKFDVESAVILEGTKYSFSERIGDLFHTFTAPSKKELLDLVKGYRIMEHKLENGVED